MTMKKGILFLLVLSLVLGAAGTAAFAETDLTAYSVANGVVTASVFDDVTAPCSGTLRSFTLEAGDPVQAGDVLFSMLTTAVAAPEDGTVRYLFARQGDSADAATAVYGAVAALEPAGRQRLACTYAGAADYDDCRHLHIGEVLYFKLDKEKGTGVVIAAGEDAYEVEILTGEFDSGKQMDLFKNSDYSYEDKVGSGRVVLRGDVAIQASGVIAEMQVGQGDTVSKGDTLFTVMAQDADVGSSPDVAAEHDGVVASVPAAAGQQVWKGQLLARIYRTDSLEILAEVDEIDLKSLKVGDTVPVTLDTDESRVLTGTVTEISSLGTRRQNAAYFTVHVSVSEPNLMLGQSASVYLP